MNFIRIFLGICLIKSSLCVSKNEKEKRSLSTESRPIRLIDIPVGNRDPGLSLQDLDQENESTSVRNNFGMKLISSIQKVITDLISNPQAISFLLALIPTFPPAAIIGSFAMVILSVLQNPIILKFLQDILSNINPFANNFNVDDTPKYLKDFDDTNVPGLNYINESVEYATKLADSALKELNWKDLSLQELDSLSNSHSQSKADEKRKSQSRKDFDESDPLDQLRFRKRSLRRDDKTHQVGIPLSDLELN